MNQVWKSTGVKPPELAEEPDFPNELNYLWVWHRQLLGVQPLSMSELKAWNDLLQVELAGWEVEVLLSLDTIFWSERNE